MRSDARKKLADQHQAEPRTSGERDREALTEVIAAEHHRLARERVVNSPEGHAGSFADAILASGWAAAVRAEELREAADNLGEMLLSFVTDESPNSPEWDRAQRRIVAYVERSLRDRADRIETER